MNPQQPLVDLVEKALAAGEGDLVRRPVAEILIGRNELERNFDRKVDPTGSLAGGIAPGVEEAFDAASRFSPDGAERAWEALLRFGGARTEGSGKSFLWLVYKLDLGEYRLYVESRSGNVPDPGIFLIAVTDKPSEATDSLVVEEFHPSEKRFGRWLDEIEEDAGEEEWEDYDDETQIQPRRPPGRAPVTSDPYWREQREALTRRFTQALRKLRLRRGRD